MEDQPEWFRPTSGHLLGGLAVVVAMFLLAVALWDRGEGYAVALGSGAVLFGVLAWASMLRPRLGLTRDTMVLRNMLETVHVPLASIEELVVRQVLAIRVGDRRYVSSALGRSWRSLLKTRVASGRSSERVTTQSYPDFVEERIRHRCEEARTLGGVRLGSAEQLALADGVRREPAWVEIGGLVVGGLGVVLALVL